MPKHMPWERMRCHSWEVNDAPMKEMLYHDQQQYQMKRKQETYETKKVPKAQVNLVPTFLLPASVVPNGDTSIAMEMDKPPTKAKPMGVAPSKVLERR